MKRTLTTLLLIVGLHAAADACARTWRVELDGTGDFMDIQPAVDAAAAGDTIRIGPGRFDRFYPITSPAWTEPTIVGVLKDNLTFIGSGRDVTILGPVNYSGTYDENPRVFCSFGGYSAHISDLTMAQVKAGIWWEHGAIEVQRCRFDAISPDCFGAILRTDGCRIADCSYTQPEGGTAVLVINQLGSMHSFRMSDCNISGASYGVQIGYAAPNVVIERTSIAGPFWGIAIDQGSSVTIEDVVVTGATDRQLLVANASAVTIRDSEFHGGVYGIDAAGGSTIAATRLVLAETTGAAMIFSLNTRATINGSHVLPLGGWAFDCYSYHGTPVTVDLSGNYWGTADSAAIAAMIHDGNDDPSLHCTVLYEPFANGPVPTESTSWGDLKASFR